MRKITFEIARCRQIEINGHVFEILKGDLDIMQKAADIQKQYAFLSSLDLAAEVPIEDIVNGVKSVISYIDEILGKGATSKIVDNQPLGIVQAIRLMTTICQAVIEEYNEDIKERYE